MELAIIVIVVIVIAMYYGLFDSVETGARMASRKVDRLESEQIKEDIEYYNEYAIDDAKYDKAVEQKALIKSYRNI